MKTSKRIISVLLTIIMVVGTVTIGIDGALLAFAGYNWSQSGATGEVKEEDQEPGRVYLIVPETIYLNSMSDKELKDKGLGDSKYTSTSIHPFQYALNQTLDTSDGTVTADSGYTTFGSDSSNKGGVITFYCENELAGPPTIRVTGTYLVEDEERTHVSVPDKGEGGSNYKFNCSLARGAFSSYNSGYIYYTATYTEKESGKTYSTTACSYVYAPNKNTVGAASGGYDSKDEWFTTHYIYAHVSTGIFGIHSVKSNQFATSIKLGSTTISKTSGTDVDCSGSYRFYPISYRNNLRGFEVPYWCISDSGDRDNPKNSPDGTTRTNHPHNLINDDKSLSGFSCYYSRSTNEGKKNYHIGGRGEISIDTSRTKKIGDIPNLGLFSDIHGLSYTYDISSSQEKCGYYIGKTSQILDTTQNNSASEVTFRDQSFGSDRNSQTTTEKRTRYSPLLDNTNKNNFESKSIGIGDSIVSYAIHNVKMNEAAGAQAFAMVDFVGSNKKDLRDAVNKAQSYFGQLGVYGVDNSNKIVSNYFKSNDSTYYKWENFAKAYKDAVEKLNCVTAGYDGTATNFNTYITNLNTALAALQTRAMFNDNKDNTFDKYSGFAANADILKEKFYGIADSNGYPKQKVTAYAYEPTHTTSATSVSNGDVNALGKYTEYTFGADGAPVEKTGGTKGYGYALIGWSTDPGDTYPAKGTQAAKEPNGDGTYKEENETYRQSRINTFNSNYGSVNVDYKADGSYTVTGFKGSGEVGYNDTLYAVWKPNTYTVSFDPNRYVKNGDTYEIKGEPMNVSRELKNYNTATNAYDGTTVYVQAPVPVATRYTVEDEGAKSIRTSAIIAYQRKMATGTKGYYWKDEAKTEYVTGKANGFKFPITELNPENGRYYFIYDCTSTGSGKNKTYTPKTQDTTVAVTSDSYSYDRGRSRVDFGNGTCTITTVAETLDENGNKVNAPSVATTINNASKNITVTYGEAMPTGETYIPVMEGYDFMGYSLEKVDDDLIDWHSTSIGSSYYNSNNVTADFKLGDGSSADVWRYKTDDITLYAQWAPKHPAIHLMGRNGVDTQEITFGSDGTTDGRTNQPYYVRATYDSPLPELNKNMTLNTYYDSPRQGADEQYYITDKTNCNAIPTRTGYTLLGFYDRPQSAEDAGQAVCWYKAVQDVNGKVQSCVQNNNNNSDTNELRPCDFESDVYLYAWWQINTYSLRFNVQTGYITEDNGEHISETNENSGAIDTNILYLTNGKAEPDKKTNNGRDADESNASYLDYGRLDSLDRTGDNNVLMMNYEAGGVWYGCATMDYTVDYEEDSDLIIEGSRSPFNRAMSNSTYNAANDLPITAFDSGITVSLEGSDAAPKKYEFTFTANSKLSEFVLWRGDSNNRKLSRAFKWYENEEFDAIKNSKQNGIYFTKIETKQNSGGTYTITIKFECTEGALWNLGITQPSYDTAHPSSDINDFNLPLSTFHITGLKIVAEYNATEPGKVVYGDYGSTRFIANPTKKGYDFIRWELETCVKDDDDDTGAGSDEAHVHGSFSGSGDGQSYSFGVLPDEYGENGHAGNQIATAVWQAKRYKIFFDPNFDEGSVNLFEYKKFTDTTFNALKNAQEGETDNLNVTLKAIKWVEVNDNTATLTRNGVKYKKASETNNVELAENEKTVSLKDVGIKVGSKTIKDSLTASYNDTTGVFKLNGSAIYNKNFDVTKTEYQRSNGSVETVYNAQGTGYSKDVIINSYTISDSIAQGTYNFTIEALSGETKGSTNYYPFVIFGDANGTFADTKTTLCWADAAKTVSVYLPKDATRVYFGFRYDSVDDTAEDNRPDEGAKVKIKIDGAEVPVSIENFFYREFNNCEYRLKLESSSTDCEYSTPPMVVTYNKVYGTFPSCTRTGYTFAGWYKTKEEADEATESKDYSQAWNNTKRNELFLGDENITLYAAWRFVQATFYANKPAGENLTGATAASDVRINMTGTGFETITADNDDSNPKVNISAGMDYFAANEGFIPVAKLDGWKFLGWKDGNTGAWVAKYNEDGTTVAVSGQAAPSTGADNNKVYNIVPANSSGEAEDAGLYAQWEQQTYTITLNNGWYYKGETREATTGITEITVKYDEWPADIAPFDEDTIDHSQQLPTTNDGIFNGYYSEETGGTCWFDIDGKFLGKGETKLIDWVNGLYRLENGLMLYAHWTPNNKTYSLNFVTNGGQVDNFTIRGMKYNDTLPDFTMGYAVKPYTTITIPLLNNAGRFMKKAGGFAEYSTSPFSYENGKDIYVYVTLDMPGVTLKQDKLTGDNVPSPKGKADSTSVQYVIYGVYFDTANLPDSITYDSDSNIYTVTDLAGLTPYFRQYNLNNNTINTMSGRHGTGTFIEASAKTVGSEFFTKIGEDGTRYMLDGFYNVPEGGSMTNAKKYYDANGVYITGYRKDTDGNNILTAPRYRTFDETKDITIYAHWSKGKSWLTIDPNFGTWTKIAGCTKMENPPTVFDYNTRINAVGADGAQYIESYEAEDSNKTFTYMANPGTSVSLAIPKRAGYTFMGWMRTNSYGTLENEVDENGKAYFTYTFGEKSDMYIRDEDGDRFLWIHDTLKAIWVHDYITVTSLDWLNTIADGYATYLAGNDYTEAALKNKDYTVPDDLKNQVNPGEVIMRPYNRTKAEALSFTIDNSEGNIEHVYIYVRTNGPGEDDGVSLVKFKNTSTQYICRPNKDDHQTEELNGVSYSRFELYFKDTNTDKMTIGTTADEVVTFEPYSESRSGYIIIGGISIIEKEPEEQPAEEEEQNASSTQYAYLKVMSEDDILTAKRMVANRGEAAGEINGDNGNTGNRGNEGNEGRSGNNEGQSGNDKPNGDDHSGTGGTFEKGTLSIVNKEKYHNKTLGYKTTITFYCEKSNIDGNVEWCIPSVVEGYRSGNSFTVTKATRSFTIYCTATDKNGTKIVSETEKINIRQGIFARIIAFFKGLFNKLDVLYQD